MPICVFVCVRVCLGDECLHVCVYPAVCWLHVSPGASVTLCSEVSVSAAIQLWAHGAILEGMRVCPGLHICIHVAWDCLCVCTCVRVNNDVCECRWYLGQPPHRTGGETESEGVQPARELAEYREVEPPSTWPCLCV